MISQAKLRFGLAAILAVFLAGCEVPAAVVKFCASAQKAISSGKPLFEDMGASCVREVDSRQPFGQFAAAASHPGECQTIETRSQGLIAATKVLGRYFDAIEDLASGAAMKRYADDVKDLATRAATSANFTATEQTAVGSIASLLTSALESGYQRRQLGKDILQADPSVQIVLAALSSSVQGPYLDLLGDEEKKTAVRYREFVLEHPQSPEIVLTLDGRWENDRARFDAKRAAAQAYIAALRTVAQGHAKLAAQAGHLTAKEIPALIGSYSSQLEDLAPAAK